MSPSVSKFTQGNGAFNMAVEIMPKTTIALDELIAYGVLVSLSDDPALQCSHVIHEVSSDNQNKVVESMLITAGSIPVSSFVDHNVDSSDPHVTTTTLEYNSRMNSIPDCMSIKIKNHVEDENYTLVVQGTTRYKKKSGFITNYVPGSLDLVQYQVQGLDDGEIAAVLAVILEERLSNQGVTRAIEQAAKMSELLLDSKKVSFGY